MAATRGCGRQGRASGPRLRRRPCRGSLDCLRRWRDQPGYAPHPPQEQSHEPKRLQAQFDEYVRKAAGTGDAASEIEKAKQLLADGTITQAEFDAIKTKALG
jgi:Short C-terminal domain